MKVSLLRLTTVLYHFLEAYLNRFLISGAPRLCLPADHYRHSERQQTETCRQTSSQQENGQARI